jgi:short-subunit dehydrogenase
VRLGGRRVWVTGASSGIGAALVQELVRRGCRVAASARRADRLEALGSRVLAVPLDVTDRDAVIAAERRVREELGGLDIAVLNAAYWQQFTVDAWDADVLRSHFDTNVMGMAHGVEAVLPEMRRRGTGTIVGMASVAGYRGFPRSEAYGATKAAEINMLEALRIDLRPFGITVQTVCPGFVRTDLTAKNTFPMPFMLEPDDAARRICRGIEKEKAEIVFPFPMMLGMKALRLVPVRLYTGAFGAGLRRGRQIGQARRP